MFNAEDILKIRTFLQSVVWHPTPMENQNVRREGIFLWCDEWEMIEILKYLFMGKETYYGDPPPNRLKFNPLWSKEDIEMKALKIKEDLKTVDAIIAHFKLARETAYATA